MYVPASKVVAVGTVHGPKRLRHVEEDLRSAIAEAGTRRRPVPLRDPEPERAAEDQHLPDSFRDPPRVPAVVRVGHGRPTEHRGTDRVDRPRRGERGSVLAGALEEVVAAVEDREGAERGAAVAAGPGERGDIGRPAKGHPETAQVQETHNRSQGLQGTDREQRGVHHTVLLPTAAGPEPNSRRDRPHGQQHGRGLVQQHEESRECFVARRSIPERRMDGILRRARLDE